MAHYKREQKNEELYTTEQQRQRDGLRKAIKRIQSQESPYYIHRMGKISSAERKKERLTHKRIDRARKKKALEKLEITRYSSMKSKVRFIKHNQ
ncbi:hypothetical protein LNP18_06475 [Leuconostoc citreum]|uniref:hypothetical protein n=1 Tax=Leuconostoc citreum TaxID=33964 RepID=UPI002009F962|nr:hypothetical protein [Leuconostoc citreum]MCK8605749.1 hypothetical protein [Leuconostoc citreum]